jgi:hypothetical protein
MNDTVIRAQYSTGLSRSNIEQALIAAGKDIDRLQPSDLALLEHFHTMGRIATSQLVNQIGITSGNTVLEAGSGIGGTARYVEPQPLSRWGCEDFPYWDQGRRQMIRHLMTVRLAAASQRLIFFADGRRLVVAAQFCSACWQSRHTARRPPRLSDACLVRSQ